MKIFRPFQNPTDDPGIDRQLLAKPASVALVLLGANLAYQLRCRVVTDFREQDISRLNVGPADKPALVLFPADFRAVGGNGTGPAIVVKKLAIDEGAVEVEQDGLNVLFVQFSV